MMVPYSLIDNDIKGEKFKSFVSYCLKNSTQFSLTFHDYEENKRSEIYKKLNKCLKKTIQTYTWYQYKTIEKPLHIEIYHSNMVVLDTILKQFDSLFNNKKNGIEDLKNRKLFASRDYGLVFLHKDNELCESIHAPIWNSDGVCSLSFVWLSAYK